MHRSILIVSAKQAMPALATATRALGFVACVSGLSAATQEWNGADTDWNTPANWSTALPGAADIAKFNSTFSNQPSVSAPVSVGAIWGGASLGQNVTIGGASALTLAGNLSAPNGPDGQVSTGLFWESGFDLTINAPLTVGNSTTFRNNGSGTVSLTALALNGKTLTLAGTNADGVVAITGSTGAGSIVINTAGTAKLSGTHAYSDNTTLTAGTLDINGGLTLASNLTSAVGTTVTNTGAAGNLTSTGNKAMTLNGNVTGALTIQKSQNTLTLTGDNTYSGGTVLGTSTMLVIGSDTALGTGDLTTTGSTIGIRSDSMTARTLTNNVIMGGNNVFGSHSNGTLVGGNLSFGDLSLGGSNRDLTVTNALTSFASLSNSGTLTKKGSGTLQIRADAASTFAGRLVVNEGTLLVDATLSSIVGNNQVDAAGILGGSGTIGGTQTTVSGTVSPGGNGTAGTLTFTNNLIFNSTTKLTFDLGAVDASDKIAITSGALQIGAGLLNFDDFTFNTIAGFAGGTYTLIDVLSLTSISGTLGDSLSGTVGGQAATLSISGNDLILTVAAIPEPSTVAVLLGGVVLGVATTLRRRTAKSS